MDLLKRLVAGFWYLTMANLFIVSDTVPGFTTEGKHWLKPATGEVYVYINNAWQPVTSGPAYDVAYRYPITILINGIDRTEDIDPCSLQKVDAITSRVDTCSFELRDYDNMINPVPGEEVYIWKKDTEGGTAVKFFGGEISEAPKAETSPGALGFVYHIRCVDFSRRTKKALVVESYEDKTAGYIINDLKTQGYLDEFTVTNVQDGLTIDSISFNRKSAGDCIAELAQLTGYDWYVDYDKDIHFFSRETNVAPYSLTEDVTTSGHRKDLAISIDKSQLRNSVIVRGGTYLSDLYTQIKVADGQQTSFSFDYSPRAPITVYVNNVEHTLGIANADTSGKDFVYDVNEKVIKNLDHATLAASDVLKLTYKYEIEVLTEDTDDESIESIGEIEGNDGIYEHYITDSSITSLEAAHDVAIADLADHANALISGSFKTDQDGYRSGQLLTLDLPSWGYDGDTFLIQTVTAKMRSDSRFEYTIQFATTLKGLTELMCALIDKGKEIIVRHNETLNDLARLSLETSEVSDTDPTFENEVTDGVYKWGPDAAAGVWGEAQWG